MDLSERQQIIDEAVEKAILMIPEVVGNLMANHIAMRKINEEFYKKYPEFKLHKESVMSVVEKIESENPGKDYKDILDLSIEPIKSHINLVNKVGFEEVKSPPERNVNGII